MEQLNLTNEWDKTFPLSDAVEHSKVCFANRYGITLAADLYIPKNAAGELPPGQDWPAVFRFQGYTIEYGIAAAAFEIGWYKQLLSELEEQP